MPLLQVPDQQTHHHGPLAGVSQAPWPSWWAAG